MKKLLFLSILVCILASSTGYARTKEKFIDFHIFTQKEGLKKYTPLINTILSKITSSKKIKLGNTYTYKNDKEFKKKFRKQLFLKKQYGLLCKLTQSFQKPLSLQNTFLHKITLILYRKNRKTPVLKHTEQLVNTSSLTDSLTKNISTIKQLIYNTVPHIQLWASKGTAQNEIHLYWKVHKKILNRKMKYAIYRSKHIYGPYKKISSIFGYTYKDKNIIAGQKYWYYISTARKEESPLSFGFSNYKKPISLSLTKILSMQKNQKKIEVPSGLESLYDAYKKVLKPFYTSSFQIYFIMRMARSYLKKKKFTVLTNFTDFIIKRGRRVAYIINKDKYIVRFYSKRLFRVYNHCPDVEPIKKISFGKKGNGDTYTTEGWGIKKKNRVYSKGKLAKLTIPITNPKGDLILNFYINNIFRPQKKIKQQRVIVSVNGYQMTQWTARDDRNYKLLVPKEYITKNMLHITLKLPDATSYKKLKLSNDANEYAISLRYLILSRKPKGIDLFTHLLKNAAAVCIYRGKRPIILKDGTIKYLHYYEAIGIATIFDRSDKNWRSHTLLFGSSSRTLKRKLKKMRRY